MSTSHNNNNTNNNNNSNDDINNNHNKHDDNNSNKHIDNNIEIQVISATPPTSPPSSTLNLNQLRLNDNQQNVISNSNRSASPTPGGGSRRGGHTRSHSVSFSTYNSFHSPIVDNTNTNNTNNNNNNKHLNRHSINGSGDGSMVRTMSHQQIYTPPSSSSLSSLSITSDANNVVPSLSHSMSISSGLRLGHTIVNRKTTIGRASNHKKPKLKDETFESVDYYSTFEMADDDDDFNEENNKRNDAMMKNNNLNKNDLDKNSGITGSGSSVGLIGSGNGGIDGGGGDDDGNSATGKKSYADLSKIERGIGAVVLRSGSLSDIGTRASRHYDSHLNKLKYYFRKYVLKNMPFLNVTFLTLLAVCCALMNISLDFVIHRVEIARNMIYDLTPWFAVNCAIYVIFCLCFSVLAAGCVHLISGESPGSGVPEMKSILSGNMMERYLNLKTLTAKYLGIICGIGAGFPAARYGPSVHIAGCICNQLLKLKPFARLNKNELEKTSMLAAACAAGVAGAIGSPFGGVLFTVEVTSNYYKIENLWRAIFCSLVGSLFFYTWRQTGLLGNTEPTLYSTKFKPLAYSPKEYFLFVVIGIACGLISALFISVFHKLVRLRQTFSLVRHRRYFMVGSVSLITATLSLSMYPLLFASSTRVMTQLFGIDHLPQDKIFLTLLVLIVQKFFITIAIAVMPVTSGVFGPSMMIGAAVGRLIGETTAFFWGDVVPGGYAVVGAAALGAGVTRTLSPIVVMFEMTGQLSFMVPTMIASVVAVGVGDLFNKSIYDTIVYLRGLPYLGSIRHAKSYKLTAADIMKTNLDWISADMTVGQLVEALNKTGHLIYPVVEDDESMNFLGSTTRRQLLTYLDSVLRQSDNTDEAQENILAQKVNYPVDESAFSIAASTKLGKVHFLIQMVGLSHAWVLSRRKLVGVVTKKDLIKAHL